MTNIFSYLFCFSDIGWVVGHSYIIYGPLLTGAATVLYEGKPIGTPDSSTFWRIVHDYKVSTLFTAPSEYRSMTIRSKSYGAGKSDQELTTTFQPPFEPSSETTPKIFT